MDTVDWEAQWKMHSPGFKNGCWKFVGTHREIGLRAGPGFGDFSHPTTRLALGEIRQVIMGRDFIDIGCGSGILSCCAVALGASQGYGVDIDPFAVEHSRENIAHNGLQEQIQCFHSEEFVVTLERPCVALMNMIQCEQEVAWGSLHRLHGQIDTVITSGILEQDEGRYLSKVKGWGWTLQRRSVEEGWCAYTFSIEKK